MAAAAPEWIVREDAAISVLVALYLRQALDIRYPAELPPLRGAPVGVHHDLVDPALLERQWRTYWEMTVEPQAHLSPVPLMLVDDFETIVALPVEGCDELARAITPFATDALTYARDAAQRYAAGAAVGNSYRGYAGAIAQHERNTGRRAHAFELNVQVLPLTQRGVWWIGALTVAVTDGLRGDVAAFDSAIAPIIADLA